jgi:GNAT superfamily N-acetyltransferase
MDTTETEKPSVQIEELSADDAPSHIAEARELLLEYGRFVIAQPGAARFCFGALEKEAERLPHSYLDQGGGCLVATVKVATVKGTPTGFVAWRTVPVSVAPDAWELKRLWVRPAGRGLGLGRRLTEAVLDRAVAAQRRAVYLDTAPAAMASAHRLYLDLGFEPCPPYNDNPVEGLAYLVKYL